MTQYSPELEFQALLNGVLDIVEEREPQLSGAPTPRIRELLGSLWRSNVERRPVEETTFQGVESLLTQVEPPEAVRQIIVTAVNHLHAASVSQSRGLAVAGGSTLPMSPDYRRRILERERSRPPGKKLNTAQIVSKWQALHEEAMEQAALNPPDLSTIRTPDGRLAVDLQTDLLLEDSGDGTFEDLDALLDLLESEEDTVLPGDWTPAYQAVKFVLSSGTQFLACKVLQVAVEGGTWRLTLDQSVPEAFRDPSLQYRMRVVEALEQSALAGVVPLASLSTKDRVLMVQPAHASVLDALTEVYVESIQDIWFTMTRPLN